MLFEKIALIGVGLLGGSLGAVARSHGSNPQRRGLAQRVAGFVRRPESALECAQANVTDEASLNLEAIVRDADLIVLCTPIAQMRPITERFIPFAKPGAIVTDVGSVKAEIVRSLEPLCSKAGLHFVGSHPMAGGEKTGPDRKSTRLNSSHSSVSRMPSSA